MNMNFRQYRKLALAAGVAACAIAVPAQARDGYGYVGLDAGIVIPQDTKIDVSTFNNAIVVDNKKGYDVDVKVGYDWGMIRTEAELDSAVAEAGRDGLHGLFIDQSPFFLGRRTMIAALAARERLPAIYGYREHAEAGGLISYGSSLAAAYRQVGRLIDKVLKGEKPADIPVEQASTFELVVNNKTAKTLRLNIPEAFLLRADDVIE